MAKKIRGRKAEHGSPISLMGHFASVMDSTLTGRKREEVHSDHEAPPQKYYLRTSSALGRVRLLSPV